MELFYRKFGEGKPVIILHGLLGMSDNWVSIGKKIAEENFSVYIPDQRNHGNSPHSDAFNYSLLADDIHEFIIQHGLLQPIIIGHSIGGKAAMYFTLSHPEEVSKLIVVDIGVKKYSMQDSIVIDALYETDVANVLSRQEVEGQLLLKIKSKRVVQFLMKNLYRKKDNSFEWKLNVEAIKSNFYFLQDEPQSPQTCERKTLFIRGALSDYILDDDFNGIQKYFPNADLYTIPGAGHWVHADKPAEFIEKVIDFMKQD